MHRFCKNTGNQAVPETSSDGTDRVCCSECSEPLGVSKPDIEQAFVKHTVDSQSELYPSHEVSQNELRQLYGD